MSRQQGSKDSVSLNYDAFKTMLPELLPAHRGRFALLAGQKVAGIYDTCADAEQVGEKYEQDFSIQQITDLSEDLGSFSRTVLPG